MAGEAKSYTLGLEAKLFYGAAGATAATEMTNVKDVTLNMETGEADVTTRAAEGWRLTAATLKEASVEFEIEGSIVVVVKFRQTYTKKEGLPRFSKC